ncbi:MAG: aspartyl/glutamyl-tRNA amidotransferase subunit C [Gemmatimonadaceae bacterium]
MAVTPDDLTHIALLARLSLHPDRIPALVRELNGILGHMEELSKVETGAVIASSLHEESPGQPLREDGGMPIPLLHPRESFAPSTRDGFLLVPRLGTHEAMGEDIE